MSGIGDSFMEFMRDPVAHKRKRDARSREDQPGRALHRAEPSRTPAGDFDSEEIGRQFNERSGAETLGDSYKRLRDAAKRLAPKSEDERAADEASAKRNKTKAEMIGTRG